MTKYARILLFTIALCFLVGTVHEASAKPKNITNRCNCGCQYEGADGKLHFGRDVLFTSSQACSVFQGNSAACYDHNGDYHKGKYQVCQHLGTITSDANLVEDPLYSRPPDAFDGNGDTVQGGQSTPGAFDQFFQQLLGNGAAD
jgi:hypothetical protein